MGPPDLDHDGGGRVSRGWWGWTGRHARASADLPAEQATEAPEDHRAARPAPPLRGAPGVEVWRVAWPDDTGTLWRDHDNEAEAEADAARIVALGTKTTVIYRIGEVA